MANSADKKGMNILATLANQVQKISGQYKALPSGPVDKGANISPLLGQYFKEVQEINTALLFKAREIRRLLLDGLNPQDRTLIEREERAWLSGGLPDQKNEEPSELFKQFLAKIETELEPWELQSKRVKAALRERLSSEQQEQLRKELQKHNDKMFE